MKKALILANGDPPLKRDINYFKSKGYTTLICSDGGSNIAYKMKIVPDLVIGDFDSIKQETLDYFRDKSKVIRMERQNDTDVEKAIKFLIKKKYEKVILLGATGDRLDHTICNLGIVLKFFDRINISVLHRKSFLTAHSGFVSLKTVKNEVISIYGFDNNTEITSRGLKYRLKRESLPFGKRESTSNVAIRNNVELEISSGIIFLIRDFSLIKNYDLI
jgi:thiamine pyrophosphokinase